MFCRLWLWLSHHQPSYIAGSWIQHKECGKSVCTVASQQTHINGNVYYYISYIGAVCSVQYLPCLLYRCQSALLVLWPLQMCYEKWQTPITGTLTHTPFPSIPILIHSTIFSFWLNDFLCLLLVILLVCSRLNEKRTYLGYILVQQNQVRANGQVFSLRFQVVDSDSMVVCVVS